MPGPVDPGRLRCAFVVDVVAKYAQAPVLPGPISHLVGEAAGELVEPVGRMFPALVPFVVLDFDEDAEADTAGAAHRATLRGLDIWVGEQPSHFTHSAVPTVLQTSGQSTEHCPVPWRRRRRSAMAFPLICQTGRECIGHTASGSKSLSRATS